MLTWLLIIFVVALALAPLSHFAPSKRQRQVARMREQAALQGLFVEFRTPPGTASGRQPVAQGGGFLYYGKRLPATLTSGLKPVAWVRRDEGWRSLRERVVAPACLEELPLSVSAASIDQDSCGVYWEESVDADEAEAAVARICTSLDAWYSTLAG